MSESSQSTTGVAIEAAYCPICGCKLHVEEGGIETGKRLLCDQHGEMRVYLSRDPKKEAP